MHFILCLLLFFIQLHANYENPKVDFDSSQQIINNDLLHLHILPNLVNEKKLLLIKEWIDAMTPQAYEEFDQRIGITWDDFWYTIQTQKVEIDPVAKTVFLNGINTAQNPESIFTYKGIAYILCNDILPEYFKCVSNHVTLPEKVYLQTFVLRSFLTKDQEGKKQLVRWHQDPSEYDTVADYTLVLMLCDATDEKNGWQGGDLLVKNGLPAQQEPAIKITPHYNQAVLFNNKLNSHMVSNIKPFNNQGTRDIMIINLYLNDPQQGDKLV